MNKKGFTLIELLVVITIIMIITTSGSLYFFSFLDSTRIQTNIENIKYSIDNFDIKVKKYEIFDYEIKLHSGSLGYIYNENKFDIPFYQNIDLDFNTGTGIIKTNTSNIGGIRLLKIYKKNKLFLERILDSNDIYTGSFLESSSYIIKGTLSGEVLNKIGINYYIEDNIIKLNNNYLVLNTISKNKDKTEKCNDDLIIKNIGGKKTILCGSNTWLQSYLFFTQNGIEKFIKIN